MTLRQIFSALALLVATAAGAQNADFDLVVAADGSGQFTTLQGAIDAVPDYRKARATRILIKKGVYKEKVVIPASKGGLTLVGEDGAVITYDNYANKKNIFGENMGTSGSGTLYIFASDFTAVNLTIENSAGQVGQAVAAHVVGDRCVFRHCRFLGNQDTLYTFGENSRQYYEDCYIAGTVDFIFGKAQCVFNRCELHSVGNGYLTAPATPQGKRFGYVFYDCRMTADEGVERVALSRPWRPYAQCVYIRCELGSHITAEGWNNWGNASNEKTAYYAEYQSTGPGANPSSRAGWSHQLTSLDGYDMLTLLAGNDRWNPTK